MDERERALARSFAGLDYEGFRALAGRADLSANERIGFPDSVRGGREAAILADIRAKLPALAEGAAPGLVVDIGPGAGPLAQALVAACRAQGHALWLLDSPEMLAALPEGPGLTKRAGRFPDGTGPLPELAGQADAVLCYSVLHYVFAGQPLVPFLDAALALLKPGGALLLGDLPNASMRRRFLAGAAGRAFHRAYTGRDEDPVLATHPATEGEMDDSVLLSLVTRARALGFDAWVLPQPPGLPMANRREDILVRRP
ncbi:class I SAM-dependent methyltransferase [Roseococcus sp. DSY-14]|uniref:class I SAM-dependent methyltransferase n=1 Tax=Roseococcus sp. DSY-14 TaxID=3369650 RepID=UPI00387B30F2